MKYSIKEDVIISNPMVFLCGPLYKEKAEDRRKILKDFIINNFKKAVLPIIVDIFLNKDEINDASISIPLLEEICAAVSMKTYIFLDTFSSVAELGMFSSASATNKILVILPKDRDQLSNNLNFFVKEIYATECNANIEFIYYRPRITRVPVASDYVKEYYEFPYNTIPINLADNIKSDDSFELISKKLMLVNGSGVSDKYEEIRYSKNGNVISININLLLMFYLVASIKNIYEFSTIDNPIEYEKFLKDLILQKFISSTGNYNLQIGEISTNLSISYNTSLLIKHILKFLSMYKNKSASAGKIITRDTSFIKERHLKDYFDFTEKDISIMNDYVSNQDKYIEIIKIQKRRKTREITKYKDSDDGLRLRRLHNKIIEKLQGIYEFSANSFAYRKNYNIYKCVSKHINGVYFLKLDISKFFNSITYKQLYDVLKELLEDKMEIDIVFKESFVKLFLYGNILPLGLVSSPLVSDIFLHKYDYKMDESLKAINPNIVYTRYADDMFFSSSKVLSKEEEQKIIDLVKKELLEVKLNINEEKTLMKDLIHDGDSVKLLGLNIVKSDKGNYITVGKKYINDTSKMYLDYIHKNTNGVLNDKERHYTEKRIAGRIAYIRQIEGEQGYFKLKKRILKSTEGRVNIPDDGINFT